MNPKIAARMIAVIALAAVMTAAVMTLRESGTEDAPATSLRHSGGEPFGDKLARCRDAGMKAAEDESCRKAWAENRRRFLGTENAGTPPKIMDRVPSGERKDEVTAP